MNAKRVSWLEEEKKTKQPHHVRNDAKLRYKSFRHSLLLQSISFGNEEMRKSSQLMNHVETGLAYFASSINAIIPAASGAADEVPLN